MAKPDRSPPSAPTLHGSYPHGTAASPVSPRLSTLSSPRGVALRSPSFNSASGASQPVWIPAKKADDPDYPEYIEVGPQRTTLAETLYGDKGHAGYTQFQFAQGSRFIGKSFSAKKQNQAFSTPQYTEVGPQRTTLAATLQGDESCDGYTDFAFAQGPRYVGRNFTVPISPFQKGFSQPEYVEQGGEVQPFATMVEMVQGRGPRELSPRYKGLQMQRYLHLPSFYFRAGISCLLCSFFCNSLLVPLPHVEKIRPAQCELASASR
jgi:hypothetical protein